MKRSVVVLAGVVLVLSACSGGDASHSDSGDSGAVTSTSSELSPPAPGEQPSGFASVYSEFDFQACEKTGTSRRDQEIINFRCPGFANVALFVQQKDQRFDMDAGMDDGKFQSPPEANEIAQGMEWRLGDGTPFAVIFGIREAGAGQSDAEILPETLMVKTIGRANKPGCLVGRIAGGGIDAGQRAREMADSAMATGFVCPTLSD